MAAAEDGNIIGPYEIIKKDRLGKGAFGAVYKAINIETKAEVDAKEIPLKVRHPKDYEKTK